MLAIQGLTPQTSQHTYNELAAYGLSAPSDSPARLIPAHHRPSVLFLSIARLKKLGADVGMPSGARGAPTNTGDPLICQLEL